MVLRDGILDEFEEGRTIHSKCGIYFPKQFCPMQPMMYVMQVTCCLLQMRNSQGSDLSSDIYEGRRGQDLLVSDSPLCEWTK